MLKRFYLAKIILGLLVLGIGGLCLVFPDKVVSQTTYDETIHHSQPAVLEANYENSAKAEVLHKAEQASTGFCSCVQFVKGLTGYDKVVGKAKNWPINSTLPSVGGVVITRESSAGTYTGHVAFITSIEGNTMTLTEANYIHCKKSQRKMQIDDPIIVGFWNNI